MTDLIQSVNAVAGEENGASYFKQPIFNDSTQWVGTNMSGFSALPRGRRNYQTYFGAGEAKAGKNGYWMAFGDNPGTMMSLKLDEATDSSLETENAQRGISVRCILNDE